MKKNKKQILSFFIVALALAACRRPLPADSRTGAQPQATLTTFNEELKNRLSAVSDHVKIDYITESNEPIIIVSYDSREKSQIELLALTAQKWAAVIFSYPDITGFSVFSLRGEQDFNWRHYMVFDRKNMTEIQNARSYFEVYAAAERYFIGPNINGQLTFLLDGVPADLPVQKPIS
jgi:hypothetical protein